ncbi:uncharacterized protein LOC108667995 [Hyalella azteca]|uniref:Uncharacterized protein LOC108667995 n=1 Tax=Hyalella azteca TaxID=294128 RepID=A0A8B7NAK0_HYAAZ|nr:uncharacterized protein LOC108667995 [Hyalella azteca]
MCFGGAGGVMLGSVLAYKVELQASDLAGYVVNTTYPNMTIVRCAAVASRQENSTFCLTTSRDCIVTNASITPYYNNSDGNGYHRCYTTSKPLFDKAAALLDCSMNGNCCPQPFLNVTNVGCVYSPSFWWFPVLSHGLARKMCQSMWPTGDLYIKPTNYPALVSYLQSKGQSDVWVGATRIGTTNAFQWSDGSTVVASDYGVFQTLIPYMPPILFPQPDKQGFPPRPFGTADCLLVYTNQNVNKLGDEFCDMLKPYLCQIP